MCMCMYTLCVCMCVCHCFVPMPFLVHVNPHLFSKRQSRKPSSGQPPPPQAASPASWTRMMCHRWLCHCIPVPALTLSNYHTNSLTRRLMRAIYYYCISKFSVLSLSSSLYFFLHSAPTSLPSLYPPPPHLCLLQPPPPLPLSAFLGEWVESSMGMWDPRRAGGLPLTRAQYVCKPGASYQPVKTVSSGG